MRIELIQDTSVTIFKYPTLYFTVMHHNHKGILTPRITPILCLFTVYSLSQILSTPLSNIGSSLLL